MQESTTEFIKYLKDQGYTDLKEITGQGICGLMRFVYTTGLIVSMNEIGYEGRYCYDSFSDAYKALKSWDGVGDPLGNWIKYKGKSGERSNPNKE